MHCQLKNKALVPNKKGGVYEMVVTQKEKDLIEAIRVFNKSKVKELEDYVNQLFAEMMED